MGYSVDEFYEVRVTSSFTVSFYENLFVIYFSTLVYYERHNVSDFKGTSSNKYYSITYVVSYLTLSILLVL